MLGEKEAPKQISLIMWSIGSGEIPNCMVSEILLIKIVYFRVNKNKLVLAINIEMLFTLYICLCVQQVLLREQQNS